MEKDVLTQRVSPQTDCETGPLGRGLRIRNGKVWYGMNWIRPAKRQAIYDRDGHRCIYCGGNGDDSRLTLDHLKPVELGGTNRASNVVTACLICNSAKGKKSLKGFMTWLSEKGIDVEEVTKRIKRHVRRQLIGYKERIKK